MDDNSSMSATRRCIVAILCGRVSLFLLMTGYALFGAILFKAIEGGEEQSTPVDFQKNREECLRELWLITGLWKITNNINIYYCNTVSFLRSSVEKHIVGLIVKMTWFVYLLFTCINYLHFWWHVVTVFSLDFNCE